MPSMFTSWFQRREAARKRSALTAPSRNNGRRVFLALEALEDRYVPTTLAVTTAADNVNLAGSLRYELAHANNGDVIEIETSQTIVLTQGELYLNKNLTIEGMGQEKTISGDLLSTVFAVAPGAQVTLSNLDITGGNAILGGGVYNDGTLTVSGCNLNGNTGAFAGGAIFNLGTLTVTYSALTGNQAASGGGVYSDGGTATLSGCILSGNTAISGGGLCNSSGTLQISGCFVLSNTTGINGEGAGIYNGGSLTVTNCDVSDNSTGQGGGGGAIDNVAGAETVITGSYLSDNSAFSGGAIYNYHGTLFISSSTLVGNNSINNGGGIATDGNATIMSSVLSGNDSAWDRGGAISVTGSGTLLIVNDTLSDNGTGQGEGGAISNWGGAQADIMIGSSTFTGNGPYPVGGALGDAAGPYQDLGGNTGL